MNVRSYRDAVALVTEDGGTFRVRVEDELLFDVDDEYDVDEIVDRRTTRRP